MYNYELKTFVIWDIERQNNAFDKEGSAGREKGSRWFKLVGDYNIVAKW